jgi:hypothetical protein
VLKIQTLSASTPAAEGGRVQPQALPADSSTALRRSSHATTSSRTIRMLTRTGRMYSQDRIRARWICGRLCRLARVGRATDGHDDVRHDQAMALKAMPPATRARLAEAKLTFSEVGATAGQMPALYHHHRRAA